MPSLLRTGSCATVTPCAFAAVATTVRASPLTGSTPMCSLLPKRHWFPFFVWHISGSRFFSLFLGSAQASMIVASTIVPQHATPPSQGAPPRHQKSSQPCDSPQEEERNLQSVESVRRLPVKKIGAHEAAHGSRLHRLHIPEPSPDRLKAALQEVHPQHRLSADRRPPNPVVAIIRLDHGNPAFLVSMFLPLYIAFRAMESEKCTN